MQELLVAVAQTNPLVGAITQNTDEIIQWAEKARDELGAQLVVFPELSLVGYPPEDLLLRPGLEARIEAALQRLLTEVQGIYLVVGYPRRQGGRLYNAAAILHNGELLLEYFKQELPNYRVFDEKRYFAEGNEAAVLDIAGCQFGLTICEDIWQEGPVSKAAAAGADCVININASPYYIGKQQIREELVLKRAQDNDVAILYAHMVGGQDELVFDGSSFAVNPDGLAARAPMFERGMYSFALTRQQSDDEGQPWRWAQGSKVAPLTDLEASYKALVLGVHDYVRKNGFKQVLLGLSGGIDSALTLAIAADALGPESVTAVMMPYQYTSQISLDDARQEAENLGVTYKVIPIKPAFEGFQESLQGELELVETDGVDVTEQNLQARCRGVILMALSNRSGALVLTTGNKSEMAVGYATLYGDMCGGFDVLKDVPKMLVYELSRYRNTLSPVIPQRVIDRAPSAELAPDQVDQDNLPPYEILDEILEYYVEQDLSAQNIIDKGFDAAEVKRVIRLVDLNEYKRQQAAVGVRITGRGFGRDRRYPITSGWEIDGP